ncbi:MAG: DUF4159 domain-containing protein [bacterium]
MFRITRQKKSCLFSCLLLLVAGVMDGQAQISKAEQFTFIRIRWTDNGIRYGYGFSTTAPLWAHDYPRAEKNLYNVMKATTNIKVAKEYNILTFADDEIFEYPFIYACEIGYLKLSESEIKNLREYLLRGGFLMVDDFRFPVELNNWIREIRKVLPDRPMVELHINHPIFHCFFDLKDIEEPTPYLPNWPPKYYGIFDDQGRLMVMINYNTDVGDGWEWPDVDPGFSTESFKLGINYIIYSLTH